MPTGGIRELKNRLSFYLKRVMNGERIEVTHRSKVVALLIPARTNKAPKELLTLVEEGVASWGGGKPSASSQPVKLRGQALLELILKDWGGSPAPTLMPESLRKRVQLRGSPDPWGRVQIASTSWVAHLAMRVSLTQKL